MRLRWPTCSSELTIAAWRLGGSTESREPKLGPVATEMERRGKRSRLGDVRRLVASRNANRDRLHQTSSALEVEIQGRTALRETVIRCPAAPEMPARFKGWVAPAQKPRWLSERESILNSEYLHEMQWGSLARYWRIYRDNDGLVFQNAIGYLKDVGSRILVASGNDAEVGAMLDIACAKGWTELIFFGPDSFMSKAAAVARERGFVVAPGRLEQDAQPSMKRDRDLRDTCQNGPIESKKLASQVDSSSLFGRDEDDPWRRGR